MSVTNNLTSFCGQHGQVYYAPVYHLTEKDEDGKQKQIKDFYFHRYSRSHGALTCPGVGLSGLQTCQIAREKIIGFEKDGPGYSVLTEGRITCHNSLPETILLGAAVVGGVASIVIGLLVPHSLILYPLLFLTLSCTTGSGYAYAFSNSEYCVKFKAKPTMLTPEELARVSRAYDNETRLKIFENYITNSEPRNADAARAILKKEQLHHLKRSQDPGRAFLERISAFQRSEEKFVRAAPLIEGDYQDYLSVCQLPD